jgi:leucyl/phenylalanyl-tRNA---protein transferase
MPVYRLHDEHYSFPHPALAERSGLLAAGSDLSPERVLVAYQHGIFPWFKQDDLFFWYCPDPRWVIFPSELKVHKSMRSIFNQQKFRYSLDTCFEEVIKACATVARHEKSGESWIGQDFIDSYCALHKYGIAHSVEVWEGDELVGGLYGVSLGKVFFGESMFAYRSNASKAGFIHLVRALERAGFKLVDCQQKTEHLKSLGAKGITRSRFLDHLDKNSFEKTLVGNWAFDEEKGVVVRD